MTDTKIVKSSGKKPPRAGMGRPKGSINKATADIKAMAQQYGPEAIEKLAYLMNFAESQQAQIAATKELLDRGYGKAVQAIEASGKDGGPIELTGLAIEFIGKREG